jgi:hypothetical protein
MEGAAADRAGGPPVSALTRLIELTMPTTTTRLAAAPIRPTAPPTAPPWSPPRPRAARPAWHLDPVPRTAPDAAVRQLLARHRSEAARHAAMLARLPGAPPVIDQAIKRIRTP